MNIQHLPELLARCGEAYQPRSLDDFVGDQVDNRGSGARALAAQLQQTIRLANQNGRPACRFLLSGKPGLGKSLLAKWLQHLTGCNRWTTTKLNGTELKIERLTEIANELAMTNLFGDWRMLWVDEADAIPTTAQVRLLTVLDDLPKGVLVVCTSNTNLRAFEDRFQSRFQAFTVIPPADEEITALLRRYVPDDSEVPTIATMSGGNVRQALYDLKGLVESLSVPLAA